jgi:hypothetical protein
METFNQLLNRKQGALMARKNNFVSKRMGFESLEGRQLMAVLVNVTGGDLVVTGNGQADQVEITQLAPNLYSVEGQNGTLVNGQASGQFFATDDIRVNLGGNNDRLTVGDGVNGGFTVLNDLVIDMGAGADVVNVNGVTVRDDVSIRTGDGNDNVTFRGTVGSQPNVDFGQNDLFIDTGLRSDTVSVQNTFVRRNIVVNTGTDTFGDVVDILFANVGNNTNVSTGGGADLVRISDAGFNNDLTVITGAGNDWVSLNAVQVDEFFASLGADSDRLDMRNSSGRRGTVDGGTGNDTMLRLNSPFSEFFQSLNF